MNRNQGPTPMMPKVQVEKFSFLVHFFFTNFTWSPLGALLSFDSSCATHPQHLATTLLPTSRRQSTTLRSFFRSTRSSDSNMTTSSMPSPRHHVMKLLRLSRAWNDPARAELRYSTPFSGSRACEKRHARKIDPFVSLLLQVFLLLWANWLTVMQDFVLCVFEKTRGFYTNDSWHCFAICAASPSGIS